MRSNIEIENTKVTQLTRPIQSYSTR